MSRQGMAMNEDAARYNQNDDRTKQSKVDDAFQAIHDRLDSLGNATTNLQDRLALVTNNYPRPENPSPKAMNDGPTGDSELVNRLYEISEKISRQIGRINVVLERLDI